MVLWLGRFFFLLLYRGFIGYRLLHSTLLLFVVAALFVAGGRFFTCVVFIFRFSGLTYIFSKTYFIGVRTYLSRRGGEGRRTNKFAFCFVLCCRRLLVLSVSREKKSVIHFYVY